ncbi:23S rRNA (pseudouridine(1915)-N(3))-methyltransferase RlmH, partial [Acutalibacter muris]|uniref:23S rRNA (pseudouridine(1915)-N(3))-methyltransferase RlmH n=1 Tax=Acutalibacter muris TaxID=1796620 RepID=UPI00272E3507
RRRGPPYPAGPPGPRRPPPGAVSFVIGSSYGLADQVKGLGRGISMSPMTFPHQLARVMLCEQIYRGLQILRGAPYHK